MSDGDKRSPGGGLRRVRQQDRKTKLVSGPLFPDRADDTPDKAGDPETDAAEATAEPWEEEAAEPLAETRAKIPPTEQERFPPLPHEIARREQSQSESSGETEPKTKKRRGNWRHDFIALIFLVGSGALIAAFIWLWNNPYDPANPFALATEFVVVSETPLPPTAVTLATAAPTVTTIPPTITPLPPSLDRPFTLAESRILYAPNANGRGCDWASIAGTVTGIQGEALEGYGVQITDAQDPSRLDIKVFSGSSLTFGAGSYELILNNAPLDGQYIVQLFSPAGAPVSEEVVVFTLESCEENVAIVSFVQVAPI